MSGYVMLVCGGRDFGDFQKLDRTLVTMVARFGQPSKLVEGGALGADALARRWANENGYECITYPADWKKYGRAAGPVRNSQMLKDGNPRVVVAFEGGRGTADMIRKAKAAKKIVCVVQKNGDRYFFNLTE